jgi:NADH dehydrogenase
MSASPSPVRGATHRVVIVGGGFGGIHAARGLRNAAVAVTLVDRRNFHLFQPLLYQVATGGLSPGDIAAPLRSVVKRQRNCAVVQDEVTGLDAAARRVALRGGELEYDSLIVAAGATHHYFGHDAWAEHAPGLKTIEDATRIRSHVLSTFERAELTADDGARRALLTFVLVGGGPTGVELAGAIGELARHTLRHEFRRFAPETARVVLVEAEDRLLPGYPERLSLAAASALERLGVEVRTGCRVTAVTAEGVSVAIGDRGSEALPARTVLWAAGVQASPLAAELARTTGAERDRMGRVVVEPDLSVAGHTEISVIGDMASFRHQGSQPLPGVAPVAMQQGRYVARRIRDRLEGRATPPFRYRERGRLAVIGRASAVADLGRIRFTGYPAWLLWLFVHIMYLVGFENRLLVFIQWAFDYFTRKRGARLITEY